MRVIKHRDGTYSIKNMTYTELSTLVLMIHHDFLGNDPNEVLSDELKEKIKAFQELTVDKRKKILKDLKRYF